MKERLMEEHRFDHLARSLSAAGTRRSVLRSLVTLSLVGLFAALPGHEELRAGRRRRRKARHDPGKKKDQRNGKRRGKRKHSRCAPDCANKVCGSDGCGGACAPGCSDAVHVCDTQGRCVPPGCTDSVANGNETDVDCGGSCPPCISGQGCSTSADCQLPTTCGGGGMPNVCGTGCEITAACQAAATAAGLSARCCNDVCVAGNCCTSADCSGATLTCVNHICRLCSSTDPGCSGA